MASDESVGALLERHPIMPDEIAEEVMRRTPIGDGLSVNYEKLVIELAALLTSKKEEKFKLISDTLSNAMHTLVKHSKHKSIDIKHKLNDYFKTHITKTFPVFFNKLQEELATESPGYSDLLRTIFPKWIKSDAAREILEGQEPTYQCNVTRGEWFTKFNDKRDGKLKKRGCWICGHELHLWDGKSEGTLSGPQCEHKSPVLLAMLHYRLIQVPLKLYNVTFPDEKQKALGQIVLEWSCVLCNMVKNALNLVLENKVKGEYIVNKENVVALIEDIQSKLGKVNLGKTKAKQGDPKNIAPVWDGNSLFLDDTEYKKYVPNVEMTVMTDKQTKEQTRTPALDKTFNVDLTEIARARKQFIDNKPHMIDALQELANVSNLAIIHIKSTIESKGASVTKYQSYEIYTLLTSVRLLCNIHERKLIPFMIYAIDNPDAKPVAKPVATTTYPKASKVSKLTGPKGAAKAASKAKKGGNWQKGGTIFNSLEKKLRNHRQGLRHEQLDQYYREFNVEFVVEHFETLIISGIIQIVKDDWFSFSDYVDLCILEEKGAGGMNDFDKTFDSIHREFTEKHKIFEKALIESIHEIYVNYGEDFERIRREYTKWNSNWTDRTDLLDSELDDVIKRDDKTSGDEAKEENKNVNDRKRAKAEYDSDLFIEEVRRAQQRGSTNPYEYAENVTNNDSPAKRQAIVIANAERAQANAERARKIEEERETARQTARAIKEHTNRTSTAAATQEESEMQNYMPSSTRHHNGNNNRNNNVNSVVSEHSLSSTQQAVEDIHQLLNRERTSATTGPSVRQPDLAYHKILRENGQPNMFTNSDAHARRLAVRAQDAQAQLAALQAEAEGALSHTMAKRLADRLKAAKKTVTSTAKEAAEAAILYARQLRELADGAKGVAASAAASARRVETPQLEAMAQTTKDRANAADTEARVAEAAAQLAVEQARQVASNENSSNENALKGLTSNENVSNANSSNANSLKGYTSNAEFNEKTREMRGLSHRQYEAASYQEYLAQHQSRQQATPSAQGKQASTPAARALSTAEKRVLGKRTSKVTTGTTDLEDKRLKPSSQGGAIPKKHSTRRNKAHRTHKRVQKRNRRNTQKKYRKNKRNTRK